MYMYVYMYICVYVVYVDICIVERYNTSEVLYYAKFCQACVCNVGGQQVKHFCVICDQQYTRVVRKCLITVMFSHGCDK